MLEIRNLTAHYGHSQVLYDISIDVKSGEFVSIIGANGAGKSTLMKVIMGLVPVSAGSLLFKGKDISKSKPWERAGLKIAYVPEGRRVFGELTVAENLRIGGWVEPPADLPRRVEHVVSIFPRLGERMNQAARTMSGGEQQMLAIGRALMLEPELLLVDEISMGLMPILVNRCFEVLKQLSEAGTTILLVEQNARKALSVSHRGYVLETGHIVLEGEAAKLRDDDAVRRAYLGG
ncbi:MAG: ABC transporter ATP-binding protein [Negativicutes bacterium]|jgi:branched-chain amino acid transport system ATP-binding protein|nr:ABC transporter ATP-binding protein [Negativicutes bacterium]